MDNNNTESESRRLGGIFLIIGWIMALSLVGFLINQSMYSTKPPTINETYGGTQITIYRGYDSHFRIPGAINDVQVTFLVDTGATSIAVSEHIATKAGLNRKSKVQTETANGPSSGYLTKIEKLTINQLELHNISAIIIPNIADNEVLLGMNVLSKFNIQQTADTLTLTVPSKGE